MIQKHNTIVLIDAYSSGALYPAEFKKRGCECVHIQSSLNLSSDWFLSFNKDDFVFNIVHDGNIQKTIAALAELNVVAVLAGAECGVMLADEISEKMGLKTNGTRLSEARRNKYLTHEILRQHRIRCADQIKSDSIDEILTWATQRNVWPIVVKPMDSAGTEGVRFCHSVEEIKKAFAHIVGKTNTMGFTNSVVMAQEFLDGEEYVVDTVSCDGQHYVCDFFQEEKKMIPGHCTVYKKGTLLPSSGEIQKQLTDYVFQVLNVMGLKYGPSHNEVMMTKNGPCLIEINARLHGMSLPAFFSLCTGYGQIELSADSFLEPNAFHQHTAQPYQLKKQGRYLHFVSMQKGIVSAIRHLDKIKALPSCLGVVLNVSINGKIKKTVDLDTCPGYVKLLHKDPAVIQKDYETIRSYERDGIFVV